MRGAPGPASSWASSTWASAHSGEMASACFAMARRCLASLVSKASHMRSCARPSAVALPGRFGNLGSSPRLAMICPTIASIEAVIIALFPARFAMAAPPTFARQSNRQGRPAKRANGLIHRLQKAARPTSRGAGNRASIAGNRAFMRPRPPVSPPPSRPANGRGRNARRSPRKRRRELAARTDSLAFGRSLTLSAFLAALCFPRPLQLRLNQGHAPVESPH